MSPRIFHFAAILAFAAALVGAGSTPALAQTATEDEARNKRLSEALLRQNDHYLGESADVGGKGFGAARVGGKGMGGGTVSSAEKIAYSSRLHQLVKASWRWQNGSDHLKAKVAVDISPDGRVGNVSVIEKSGNANFDDSIVRAVYKASPFPPPPANLYEDFKRVIFNFDSAE